MTEDKDEQDFLNEGEKDSLTWALAFLQWYEKKYKKKKD